MKKFGYDFDKIVCSKRDEFEAFLQGYRIHVVESDWDLDGHWYYITVTTPSGLMSYDGFYEAAKPDIGLCVDEAIEGAEIEVHAIQS